MSLTTPYASADALYDSEGCVAMNGPMPMQPSAQVGQFDSVIFEDHNALASSEAALVPSTGHIPAKNLDRDCAQDGTVGSDSVPGDIGPAFLDVGLEDEADWHGIQPQCDDVAQNVNPVLEKAVLRSYLRSTMMPGGHLDLDATYVEKALRQSDSSSAFHTRCKFLF
jgi:hypothetical protein